MLESGLWLCWTLWQTYCAWQASGSYITIRLVTEVFWNGIHGVLNNMPSPSLQLIFTTFSLHSSFPLAIPFKWISQIIAIDLERLARSIKQCSGNFKLGNHIQWHHNNTDQVISRRIWCTINWYIWVSELVLE